MHLHATVAVHFFFYRLVTEIVRVGRAGNPRLIVPGVIIRPKFDHALADCAGWQSVDIADHQQIGHGLLKERTTADGRHTGLTHIGGERVHRSPHPAQRLVRLLQFHEVSNALEGAAELGGVVDFVGHFFGQLREIGLVDLRETNRVRNDRQRIGGRQQRRRQRQLWTLGKESH